MLNKKTKQIQDMAEEKGRRPGRSTTSRTCWTWKERKVNVLQKKVRYRCSEPRASSTLWPTCCQSLSLIPLLILWQVGIETVVEGGRLLNCSAGFVLKISINTVWYLQAIALHVTVCAQRLINHPIVCTGILCLSWSSVSYGNCGDDVSSHGSGACCSISGLRGPRVLNRDTGYSTDM